MDTGHLGMELLSWRDRAGVQSSSGARLVSTGSFGHPYGREKGGRWWLNQGNAPDGEDPELAQPSIIFIPI